MTKVEIEINVIKPVFLELDELTMENILSKCLFDIIETTLCKCKRKELQM